MKNFTGRSKSLAITIYKHCEKSESLGKYNFEFLTCVFKVVRRTLELFASSWEFSACALIQ